MVSLYKAQTKEESERLREEREIRSSLFILDLKDGKSWVDDLGQFKKLKYRICRAVRCTGLSGKASMNMSISGSSKMCVG